MSSQGIMSSMEANNNPGLCPIKGQKSCLCSQTRARVSHISLYDLQRSACSFDVNSAPRVLVQCTVGYYEGRLISNAHSEISRKRDDVFKQTKVGSRVQYFSYKLTYLFFDMVALSFNTFFPT